MHVVERRGGCPETFGGDARPSREIVDDGLARLDELVVYDNPGRVEGIGYSI